GPGLDAHRDGVAIAEPHLANGAGARWPSFTPQALRIGTGGVFAFPLAAGRARIGVLTVYQNIAGVLTADQSADGTAVSGFVTQLLLTMQSGSRSATLADSLTDNDTHRAEVHQASGMVAVQLGISVEDALLRLRAHAFAADRPVAAIALDVVERRLRLPDDDGTAPLPGPA
ncbi:MAG: hypothetical protein RJA49_99, partial [Actinomycetota bacterium]